MGRIEILIWDPRFLGDIWSARNSETFELFVCTSVVITIASERKELQTSNFANWLLLAIGRLVLKMGYIGLQDTTGTKAVYRDIGHMESPIRTKFNISACILTLNNTTKNDSHRSTGSGTSHISQIAMLGSWAHGTSDSRQIWYLGLYTNPK